MSQEQPKPKRLRRILQVAVGCASFLAGFVLGPYAEELITRANPGFFGPNNQSIIDEQQSNFAMLDEKLSQLKQAIPADAGAGELLIELGDLLAKQKELSARKDELFKETDVSSQAMKAELLKERGVSDVVGFWIAIGESVVLKDPDKVFSVARKYSDTRIDVNLSGERKQLSVGDPLEFQTSAGPCTVFFRHGQRKTDDRFGFDLTCSNPKAPQ